MRGAIVVRGALVVRGLFDVRGVVETRRGLPEPPPRSRHGVDGEGGSPRPLGREEGRWPGQGLGEASCFF
jgi:hypothetical protein